MRSVRSSRLTLVELDEIVSRREDLRGLQSHSFGKVLRSDVRCDLDCRRP